MSDILQHREGGILTLTFNRLDKKNAITTVMYNVLADAMFAAAQDESVRVVVLQGHEQVFTAGNDLADFLKNPPDMSKPDAEPAPVVRFLEALRTFPKPLLAAVAGPAVGIGTTLLLHCDLVYAADNAAFSLPFVNLGLCPEAGASLLLPALMATRARPKSSSWARPSTPKRPWRWAWSTACCRQVKSTPTPRRRLPSWPPSPWRRSRPPRP